MRRLALIVIGLVLAVGSSTAQSGAATEWVTLAGTDQFTWEGHAGTVRATTTRGGTQVVVAQGRVTDKKTTVVTFQKWYVSVTDCRAGNGKLVTLDMEGNFQGENDFVLHGGTVASSLAEMLCSDVINNDKKGI